ncbi:MAG: monovalent cation/H+ antiporter complex subunit F [Verrucomicrobiota bacterium]
MIEYVTIFCSVVLMFGILAGLFRMAVGPTILDRILAFDMVAISAVALMGILSIRWHTELFLELILIFSLLGFFGTVALVFYLQKTYPAYPADEPEQEDEHDGSL